MKPVLTHSATPVEIVAKLDAAIALRAREVLTGAPERLEEAVLYGLLGPGKRIRPRLLLAVSDALDLDPHVALTLATAIEMTHAYTLVHDDLPAMDDDDFRRGRPTNHKVYGEGLAILAGDSLALLAPDLLLRLGDSLAPERIVAVTLALLEAAGPRGVVAGQAAEMGLIASAESADLTRLFEVFRLKTGALFRAALTLPAIAAGADAATVEILGQLGDDLGIAFQIADDLEDDFSQRKFDRAHIASYAEPSSMRAEAVKKLRAPLGLPPRISAGIEPFIAELRDKVTDAVK